MATLLLRFVVKHAKADKFVRSKAKGVCGQEDLGSGAVSWFIGEDGDIPIRVEAVNQT